MATDKTPQPLDYSFTAPIEKDGAFATFLTVPGSAHHSTAMFAWGQSAPMRNMTEVLKSATLNEEEKQYSLAILTRQLGNMSRMIDDLLDAARITQGKIELRKKVVALEEIVKAAVSLAQADGMKRGQEVLLQLPDETR